MRFHRHVLSSLLLAAAASARCTTTVSPPRCSDTICVFTTNTGCGWVVGGCYLHSTCGGTYSTKPCTTTAETTREEVGAVRTALRGSGLMRSSRLRQLRR